MRHPESHRRASGAPPVTRDGIDSGRRRLLRAAALAAPFVAAAPSLLLARGTDEDGDGSYEVVRKRIRIRHLPQRLRGLTIAVLSDIHSGPYMSREDMDRYVAGVNALRPDVIVLPGDFVYNKVAEAEPLGEAMRGLRAEYGAYACLGNHDFYADADVVARELTLAGVRVLRNEHLALDARGERLDLIGVDDVRPGHPFDHLFRTAVGDLTRRHPSLLLCHKPYYLDSASEWGVDLVVSGHTHGGQIVLARLPGAVITPAALISGYVEGLYRRDATQMYVTRGVGVVGIPVRINCPAEITLLSLV